MFKHLKRKFIIVCVAVLSVQVVFSASAQVVEVLTTETVRGWNYTGEKQLGGETTSEFHGKWVNYLADSGWKGIDTAFYRDLDGYTMKDAPFEVYLPFRSTGVATFHNNNKWDIFGSKEITDAPMDMTMQALGVNDVAGVAQTGDLMLPGGMAKGVSYVVYEGAYADGDLIYYVHHGTAPRLEKLIRFSRAPQPDVANGATASYQFKIGYPTGAPEFRVEINGEKKKWDEANDEEMTTQEIKKTTNQESNGQQESNEAINQESTTTQESNETVEQGSNTTDGDASTTPEVIPEEEQATTTPTTENPSPAGDSLYERENNDATTTDDSSLGGENNDATTTDDSSFPKGGGRSPEDFSSGDASTTPETQPTSTVPALFTLIVGEDGTIIDDGATTTDDSSFPKGGAQGAEDFSSGDASTTPDAENPSPEGDSLDGGEQNPSPQAVPSLYERENDAATTTDDSSLGGENNDATTTDDSSFPKGGAQGAEDFSSGDASTTPESTTTPDTQNPSPEGDSLYERENNGDNNGSGKGSNLHLKKAKITNSEGKAIAVNAAGSDVRGISFKPFQVWDSNETRDESGLPLQKVQPIQVDMQATENAGEYILTKIIPIDFFAGATFPVFTDTTTDFFPDPNVEVTSVDGYADRNVVGSFATIRAGAGTDNSPSSADMYLVRLAPSCPDYSVMLVSFFLFDTSTLGAGSTVSSATFSFKGSAKSDFMGQSIVITNSNPDSNTDIASPDYTDHTTQMATEYGSSRMTITAFSTTGYNDFALNATGVSNVSKTGITKLGARGSGDFDNSEPTCAASNAYAYGSSADTAGTASDPKLSVTYTAATNAPQMMWSFTSLQPKVAIAKVVDWLGGAGSKAIKQMNKKAKNPPRPPLGKGESDMDWRFSAFML